MTMYIDATRLTFENGLEIGKVTRSRLLINRIKEEYKQ